MFKALSVYTITGEGVAPFGSEPLAEFLFHTLNREEEVVSRLGFVPNVEGEMVSNIAGNHCMRLATQQKKVNKYELGLLVEAKQTLFEEEYGTPMNKKQVDTTRLEMTEALLSTTMPEEPKYIDLIMTPCGKVMVSEGSKKAEEVLALLRTAIGSLPVIPMTVEKEPCTVMTDNVIGGLNETLTLSDKIVMTTSDELKVVVSGAGARSDEALDTIEKGAYVTQLMYEYDGMTKFLLKEDMTLSGIKFSKDLTAEAEDGDKVGTHIIVVAELKKCVNELIKEFGGLVDNG